MSSFNFHFHFITEDNYRQSIKCHQPIKSDCGFYLMITQIVLKISAYYSQRINQEIADMHFLMVVLMEMPLLHDVFTPKNFLTEEFLVHCFKIFINFVNQIHLELAIETLMGLRQICIDVEYEELHFKDNRRKSRNQYKKDISNTVEIMM